MDIEKAHEPREEAELVERVRQLAYQFARRLASIADAEDLAQDVAFDCLLKLRKGQLRLEPSLEALVASMTWRKHACRGRGERHRRDVEDQYVAERNASAPAWTHPARGLEHQEEAMMRQKALAELSPLTRLVYRMVRELGATHRFTARSMGISKGLVSFHLKRAERHLMEQLVHLPGWSSTPPTMRLPSRTRVKTDPAVIRAAPFTREDDDEATMTNPEAREYSQRAAHHELGPHSPLSNRTSCRLPKATCSSRSGA